MSSCVGLSFLLNILRLAATKLPAQRICTFAETLDLLMQPGSKDVVLNIDVKLDNDPEVLYPLMKREIESFPGWETELAPRLILGASLARCAQLHSYARAPC